MSKINIESATSSYERFNSELQNLMKLMSSQKDTLEQHIINYKEKIDGQSKKAETLNGSITTLTNKKKFKLEEEEQKRKEFAGIIENIEKFEKQISEFSHSLKMLDEELQQKEREKGTLTVSIESIEKNLKDNENKNNSLIEEISSLEQEITRQVQEKEKEKESLSVQHTRIVIRSKSLLYLLKHDIVVLPEVKVIRTLKNPEWTTKKI